MLNFELQSDNVIIFSEILNEELIVHDVMGSKVNVYSKLNGKWNIPFNEINIYEDKISFNGSDEVVFLNDLFDKYILDTRFLEDEFYMTKNIANAATRPYNQNEIFFVCYQALNILPVENHFYASCITLCSYKALELNINSEGFLNSIYHRWTVLDKECVLNSANKVRWYISCSMSLSLLMLVSSQLSIATDMLHNSSNKAAFSHRYNHLAYWNYCQLAFLNGLTYIYNDDFEQASIWFLESFNVSRSGLMDIYNPRNDWLLGQLSDCEALLKLGSQALICSIKTSGGEIARETRTTQKCAKNKKVDIQVIFSRVSSLKNKKIFFFEEVSRKLEV